MKVAGASFFRVGVLSLAIGGICLVAGAVPVIGVLLGFIAADWLCVGVGCLLLAMVTFIRGRSPPAWVVVPAILLFAVNTRLPALFSDALAARRLVEHEFGSVQVLPVGHPVHLTGGTEDVVVRRYPYASAAGRRCADSHCFTFGGIELARNLYVSESPAQLLRAAGFSLARKGESAPTLDVQQKDAGGVKWVHLRLLDAKGGVLARATHRYRNAFPLEPSGNEAAVAPAMLWLHFMLHGHLLNVLLGEAMPQPPSHPVRDFLQRTLVVQASGPVTMQEPEVVSERLYQPPQLLPGGGDALLRDGRRHAYCDQLLRREGSQYTSDETAWWQFVQDPSGRKKMQKKGSVLCAPEGIWMLETHHGAPATTTITRFAPAGELVYRMAFRHPQAAAGYHGLIRAGTFHAQGGYLEVEWAEQRHATTGSDRHLRRVVRLRVPEPSGEERHRR